MKAEDLNKLHQVMRRAHSDDSFKARLLKNPREVFEKEGVELSKDKQIRVMENTKDTFYLSIPKRRIPKEAMLRELPKNSTLGHVTAWITTQIQEGTPLKEKLLKNPTEELAKLGVNMPKGLRVKLLLNTDSEMYFVIPRKISEGEELHDMELQAVSGGKGDSTAVDKPTENMDTSIAASISHSFDSTTQNTDSGNTTMGGHNSLFLMGSNFGTIDQG
ncbi:MAG: hypothetical protein S4CHLAM37_07750 [Chlamydiia bacterium]|nr:hypothetical protein [Chlamydiia bacterium]